MNGKSSSPDDAGIEVASIEAIADLLYVQPLIARPDGEKVFGEMCVLKFDAPAVIRLLLDPSPSFYGHKEATFAAFLSWVLAPDDETLRLEFIALAIKRLLAKAEEKAAELELSSPLHLDLAARYVIAGPQFIEQIYCSTSGMSLMAEHGSPAVTDIAFDLDRSPINTINKMMVYCHHIADDPGNGQPSVNRTIEVVGRIPEHGISSRSAIYAEWAKCKDNIALIYAASSIKRGSGSLLDDLLTGDAEYAKYTSYLPEWIGRARYVCEHILVQMPDDQLYQINVKPLRQVDSLPFSPRTFTASELAAIRA